MLEYIKHLIIRTPFEQPAQQLQYFLELQQGKTKPELAEIYREPFRIDEVLKRVISPSSNCIDIGCYLGSVLSKIMRLAPEGNHLAFEPIPNKVRWLKEKFPEVDIKEIALSDKSEKTSFYINTKCSGFSGLKQHSFANNEYFQEISVRCEKLDNILKPDYQVDFIKIDVEGAEFAVFQGAINTLKTYHPVLLFECTLSALSLFNFTPEQIFDFLTQNSYSIFLLKDFLKNKKSLTLEQFNKALQYPPQGINFLAIANQ